MAQKKQIEEMAMLICRSKNPSMEKQCSECVFNYMCDIQDGCEILIDNGYRKASDVVEEIEKKVLRPILKAYKKKIHGGRIK